MRANGQPGESRRNIQHPAPNVEQPMAARIPVLPAIRCWRLDAGWFRLKGARWTGVLMLACAFSMASGARGQNSPHIGYVYPAGGRQGATFEVTVGGQYLGGVTNVVFSGTGAQGVVVEYIKPLSQRELNELRDKARELQQKKQAASRNTRRGGPNASTGATNAVWTAEDEEAVAGLKEKAVLHLRTPVTPAIAETVTLRVTMTANAAPGEREMRLGTASGLSNPLVFCVDELREFAKKPPSASVEVFNFQTFRAGREAKATPRTEMSITLPAIVNGQILPGGVDRFRFQARQGQQLVAAVRARSLVPYLPDAVPGWFQAALALYDAKGKEVAFAGDFRFQPDPVLHCEIPSDGEYVLEIRDAVYRGREDFVYRITVGELPYVTSVFPLGGPAGAATAVELTGWNLTTTNLTHGAGLTEPGIHSVSVRSGKRDSNRVPFAVDTLPELFEQEPNNTPENAQRITAPVIVNGRIARSGDWDLFHIEGRAGDEIVAEVHARRLGSPLDSVLKLTDAGGGQIAINDDHEDKGSGLNTHHADSYLRAVLPADGMYTLHLGDAQHNGGAAYGYRLRISAPRPDFELRVAPSSISARAGASVPITVYALRRDGFTNEIVLALKEAPEGFVLSGARVPANCDEVRLTLTAPPAPVKKPLNLSLEGYASIGGRTVFRPAIPADDMMQAFAYRHLVPAHELTVAVSGRASQQAPVKILSSDPVRIPAGGTATVRIAAPGGSSASRFQLKLDEPPEGIVIQNVSMIRQGADIALRSDAAKAKPGLEGNLIVNVFSASPQNAGNARRSTLLGTLPAIAFEIVEP